MLNSYDLVDPGLRPALETFLTPVINAQTLADIRAQPLIAPPFDARGVSLDKVNVPGPAGAPDVPLLIYRPEDTAGPVGCIFHIHGGGYVTGAAADMEFLHRPLVRALGCALVSVEYRLAPEASFPAPLDDCHAGLSWLFTHAAAWGIDPGRIGVMGESAGGGLAAALALLVRDRGEHRLAFQHLIYPMLDDRTCTRDDPHPHAGEFIWNGASNHFGWSSLLGHEPGIAGVSPYAAPARAETLAGLPPTFIMTGTLDLFLEEDIDYARRLMHAGVPTELHVYAGAFHAFDILSDAEISRAATSDSHRALARFLGPPASVGD